MATIATNNGNNGTHQEPVTAMALTLEISDPNVIGYLAEFEDAELRAEKANEALKVGVIAIQSASPTLDTAVVQEKFSDLNTSMKDCLDAFATDVKDGIANYFRDEDGVVPKSLQKVFGENGKLGKVFENYFHPQAGRLAQMMLDQIGPASPFAKSLDPMNKEGIIAQVEKKVECLVDQRLKMVLGELSLDNDNSAMSRLQAMLSKQFSEISKTLGVQEGAAVEAARGHVKGMEFEEELYAAFAKAGREVDDDTELVRGTAGVTSRCKKGDFVATLGDSSGAPGLKLVVEVKSSPMKCKDAVAELQEAKKNRGACVGIFVFAKGCEPDEIGDFRRIGDDFYCTVDRDHLQAGIPPLFLDVAYKAGRVLAITAKRRESAGALDIAKIEANVDALLEWTSRIEEMATKARTIQTSGSFIEKCIGELKDAMNSKLKEILTALHAEPTDAGSGC
ncbi:MAG: hypothetical protein U1D30_06635 [Planctomycetota bacterium]